MGSDYRIRGVLAEFWKFVRCERRRRDAGVAALARAAVGRELDEETIVVLCRLLFRSPAGRPLRPPRRGALAAVAEPKSHRWPLAPVHVYRGAPFYIAHGWTIAGRQESASDYLAHCRRYGRWAPHTLRRPNDVRLAEVAREFVELGPWAKPLTATQRAFFLRQTAKE